MNRIESGSRRLDLDGLRGLAVLIVVLYHYCFRYFELFSANIQPHTVFQFGRFGVEVFFVLSGHLIFSGLLNQKSLLYFATHRAFRIFPSYWACIFISFVALHFSGLEGRNVSLVDALINLTMLQRIFSVPNVDGVYWSLFVEVIFYFWIILLAALFGREKAPFYLLSFSLALATLSFLIPLFGPAQVLFIPAYLPYFLIGITCSIFSSGRRAVLPFSGTILLVFLGAWKGWLEPAGIAFAIFTAMLICFPKQMPFHGILSRRAFVFLGSISYPLYLVHQNVGYSIISSATAQGLPFFGAVLLAIFVTSFIAYIVSRSIERKFIMFSKKKFSTHQVIPA